MPISTITPYKDNTVIHINVSGYSDFTICIYDVVGHLISQQKASSDTDFDLPLSGFQQSAGMYLIQVADPHNKVVLKFIKL